MNVLTEMTALNLHRPAPNATPDTVAAWFEAKALLHEHLAAEGGSDAGQPRAWAAAAHERARTMSLGRAA